MASVKKQAKIRIAVAGALGRMGRAVLAVCQQHPGIEIVGGWERPNHNDLGRDLGEAAGLPRLGVPLSARAQDVIGSAQAVIDFSVPASTLLTLDAALKQPRALVIGTTGMEKRELAVLGNAAKRLPIVFSSNFSVGINLLWKIAAEVAKVTRDEYDIEIVDLHHHHKKDSPSGTAVTTGIVLAKALGRDFDKNIIYGRRTRVGKRPPTEIGIHALRLGDIVGDHTIYFAGAGERLELTHRAHSRENFASGALKAAQWLIQKKRKAGLYRMAQVLGFEA